MVRSQKLKIVESLNKSTRVTFLALNEVIHAKLENTGIGIEEDKIDYIFERFYRIDPSRKSGTSGLGLSICRAFGTAHAGTIKVKKLIPNGSHFIIELPQ